MGSLNLNIYQNIHLRPVISDCHGYGKNITKKIERTNKYQYHLTPIKFTQINQMSYGLLGCFKNIIKTRTWSTLHLDYTSYPIVQNLRGLFQLLLF